MRNRTDYLTRAKRFIRMIEPYLRDGGLENKWKAEKAIQNFNRRYSRKVMVAAGLTRIVFISSDYVVKVDYGCENIWFGGCENEVSVYEKAKKDGYDYLFAPITRYEYGGQNWYIMPRIGGIGRYEYNAFSFLTWEECEWVEAHIGDLHEYNYGWRNNRPVIFDYAMEVREEDE